MNFDLIGTKRAFVDKSKAFTSPAVSGSYSQQRVRYSDEFFQVVADYCGETLHELNLALDVGCGPGNSTLGFTKHFKRVIGTDISPAQIAAAPRDIPNCEFKVVHSHQHPFIESGSVDLFSCGMALHYMDIPETLREADRVLRPGGTIAIFGYNEPKSPYPSVTRYFQKVYSGLMAYWDPCMQILYEEYKSVELPYPDWKRHTGLKVKFVTTPKGFLKQLDSLSIYPAVAQDNPHFLEQVEGGLAQAVRADNGDEKNLEFEYYHDITLLLGHKPINNS